MQVTEPVTTELRELNRDRALVFIAISAAAISGVQMPMVQGPVRTARHHFFFLRGP
jgi:hypothetical protein